MQKRRIGQLLFRTAIYNCKEEMNLFDDFSRLSGTLAHEKRSQDSFGLRRRHNAEPPAERSAPGTSGSDDFLRKTVHQALNHAEEALSKSLQKISTTLNEQGDQYTLLFPTLGSHSSALDDDAFSEQAKTILTDFDTSMTVLKTQLKEHTHLLGRHLFEHHTVVSELLASKATLLASKLHVLQTARKHALVYQQALRTGNYDILPVLSKRSVAKLHLEDTHTKENTEKETENQAKDVKQEQEEAEGDEYEQQQEQEDNLTTTKSQTLSSFPSSTRAALSLSPTSTSTSPAQDETLVRELEAMTSSEALFLDQYQTQLDTQEEELLSDVLRAESTVFDLARLQARLNEQLHVQQEQIAMIDHDTMTTLENVEQGNQELAEAVKYHRDFRIGVLLFFVILSLSLLLLDFVKG